MVRTPTGLTRVREVPADLVRFATGVGPDPASTLIVQRRGRPEGVALGPGDVSRLSVGNVFPLRGRRPAVRAVAATGPLLLSFDTAADRDRAAAEVLDETGIGGDDERGRPPVAPTAPTGPNGPNGPTPPTLPSEEP